MRRSPFEIIVVIIVVTLSVLLAAGLYAGRMKIQKSNLLIQELSMLRSSLMLFKTVNHENAQNLKTLVDSEYEAGGEQRAYLDDLPLSAAGDVIDPFGNPYAYDRKTGWVSSSSPGFERW
jgi:type II secretory pathway pseudopilin PulG